MRVAGEPRSFDQDVRVAIGIDQMIRIAVCQVAVAYGHLGRIIGDDAAAYRIVDINPFDQCAARRAITLIVVEATNIDSALPQEEAPEDVASSGVDGGCAVAQASFGADEPESRGFVWVLLALGLFVATRRT